MADRVHLIIPPTRIPCWTTAWTYYTKHIKTHTEYKICRFKCAFEHAPLHYKVIWIRVATLTIPGIFWIKVATLITMRMSFG